LKPIITVYSAGTLEGTKKFEGYITAAFWIGVENAEGDGGSVKVRQPIESYDDEVAALMEFAALMVQRQINFAVEFFAEPTQPQAQEEAGPPQRLVEEPMPTIPAEAGETDYEGELTKIKEQYKKGLVTKKQYDAKKEALLRRWKEKVEGRLGK
jgi:hypothetical protein